MFPSRLLLRYFAASTRSLGIPVGAVELPPQQVHSFRLLLQDVLQQPIHFREVEKSVDDGTFTIHLPPLAAASLDDEHPTLMSFLNTNSGEYLPGVRRKCPTLDLHLPAAPDPTSTFQFVDLFAGIGGFRLGLEHIGGQCVLSNEIDKKVAAIYKKNFPNDNCLAVGDILDIDSDKLLAFDCLVGGFPCQPFSQRGNQQGLADDRGQLYRELARILQERQPKCFLFENVPGLVLLEGGSRTVSSKGEMPQFQSGAVLERILDTFASCGYQVDWQVLNSRKWLAQMRERVYIVGTRNDLDCPPIADWDSLMLKDLKEECPTTVRNILETKDSPAVLASQLTERQYEKLKNDHAKKGTTIGCIDINGKAPTLISRYHSVSSMTAKFIWEEADGTKLERPRFLTPRECTRLMGFPEEFVVPTPENKMPVSRYYKAIGNAVCPIVISSIGKELLKCTSAEV